MPPEHNVPLAQMLAISSLEINGHPLVFDCTCTYAVSEMSTLRFNLSATWISTLIHGGVGGSLLRNGIGKIWERLARNQSPLELRCFTRRRSGSLSPLIERLSDVKNLFLNFFLSRMKK
jgi:hypothetical protein